jgi:protein-disulfide isomerase
MTHSVRFFALLLLTACKGAENARATNTPSATGAAPATAAAPAPATTPAPTAQAAPDPMVTRADSGRIRGNPAAKVWMIIASDFQCPYCKMWHDSADVTIRREYVDNGKVRLAFINFPIGSHQNAVPAAEYAMCASAQNKFWEMHDAIFGVQAKWTAEPDPTATFEQLASSIGADMAALRACISSHKMRPMIEADRDKASQAGVRATPSFFIGNQILEGVQMPSDLRKALDAAIAGAR